MEGTPRLHLVISLMRRDQPTRKPEQIRYHIFSTARTPAQNATKSADSDRTEPTGLNGNYTERAAAANAGTHGLNHVFCATIVFAKLLKLHALVGLGRFEHPTPWLQTAISNLLNLAGAGVLQTDITVCGKWRKTESPFGPRQIGLICCHLPQLVSHF